MKNQTSNNNVYDTTIKLLILLVVISWCIMILLPFVNILLWSLILALAIYPLHNKLAQKIGGRPKLASFIIVFFAMAIIFVPSWFIIDSVIHEIKELKVNFDADLYKIPSPTEKVKEWPIIGKKAYDLWLNTSVNLEQTILKYQDQLTEFGSKLAKGIFGAVGAIFQIAISFIIACILLIFGGVGEAIRKFFRKIAGEKGDEFTDITIKTVGNVVKGVLGVAFIVAALHGIIFMIAGIPYAGVWALLAFILGVLQLPLIFITLPIIVYLFAVKSTTMAIIWTVVVLVAGLSDNFLKPILLGKGAAVPMLVIFIGVIGGFIFSGFIGLFTGAIVLSLGYKLFIGWVNSGNELQ
jgi:predicted PurR-regulated permease PerM